MDKWELYDLEADPNEGTNQYGNPEYKSVIKELKAKIDQLQVKYQIPKA